jgi:hypothetical protein
MRRISPWQSLLALSHGYVAAGHDLLALRAEAKVDKAPRRTGGLFCGDEMKGQTEAVRAAGNLFWRWDDLLDRYGLDPGFCLE